MEILEFLSASNVVTFFLLFMRFSSIMILYPFFSHNAIPISVKTALSFYLTLLFFPITPPCTIPLDFASLGTALLSEAIFGLCTGYVLQIAFYMMMYAGEQIAFIMGFTMASVIDPQTGTQTQIISNLLTLLGLILLLIFDAHHVMLLLIYKSLLHVPLGGFILTDTMGTYIIHSVTYLFIVGFTLSFPIVALSLLSDLIFGMLMKTMPQFNLLVIGFPIKITLAFAIVIAILGGMLTLFRLEFEKTVTFLNGII